MCEELVRRRYALGVALKEVLERLPFPDPGLTLGEAMLLAKGRTAAHRKLKQQVKHIVS